MQGRFFSRLSGLRGIARPFACCRPTTFRINLLLSLLPPFLLSRLPPAPSGVGGLVCVVFVNYLLHIFTNANNWVIVFPQARGVRFSSHSSGATLCSASHEPFIEPTIQPARETLRGLLSFWHLQARYGCPCRAISHNCEIWPSPKARVTRFGDMAKSRAGTYQMRGYLASRRRDAVIPAAPGCLRRISSGYCAA
jgi:hypothetical protein